jgi:cytochrome c1
MGLIAAAMSVLAGCAGHVTGVPEPRQSADERIAAGRRLMAHYGCGSCHYIPGVPGADAMAAPPLDYFYQRSTIAGQLGNNEANLIQWIQDPQAIAPGTAMPDLGVSEEEARAIAAYLYHEPGWIVDWVRR